VRLSSTLFLLLPPASLTEDSVRIKVNVCLRESVLVHQKKNVDQNTIKPKGQIVPSMMIVLVETAISALENAKSRT
jgi:hypothetical protein